MQIRIKRGYDMPLAGAVSPNASAVDVQSPLVAVIPDDFQGFVPKIEVHEGDAVMAGSPLAHHKSNVDIKLTSPVAGTVKAIVRGDRRKVLAIIVQRGDDATKSHKFDFDRNNREQCAAAMAASGLMLMTRQRPYDIIGDHRVVYRDIFVTAFDSAPLAVDATLGLSTDPEVLSAGVKMLKSLTTGNVYVARRRGTLADIDGAVMVDVEGPHPASLPGTHINYIAPVNKGERVLTLELPTLANAGRLYTDGTIDYTTTVAVVGSEADGPRLVNCTIGTTIEAIVRKVDPAKHIRIISGNVLTGVTVALDGYLRAPYRQVTLMPEGDDVAEFMGWASLSPSKLSVNPSFPGKWLKRLFTPDARIKGGRRAIIQSGEYERMIPLDIMPEYLIKAIKSHDIDNMERLGIYEVAPEDFALAEFVDSSKQPLQNIVREGLDYLRGELED